MRRKKPTAKVQYALFDVLYADGTQSSNRKVPSYELEGLDSESRIRQIIEEQDLKIIQQSGRALPPIKSVVRSGRS